MAKLNPMSSYAVQLREYERRLLRSAFAEVGGDHDAAADLLGLHRLYLKARCTYLGGVTDATKHEPPLSEAKVVLQNVRKREERAVERAQRTAVAADRPKVVAPEPGPICCPRFAYGDATHDITCRENTASDTSDPDPEEAHA